MKRAIPSLYAEYGRYVDEFRAIPYYVDCLKPVERRLLFTLFKVAKRLTKSARVIGEVIGKYHPHGDQSAYGTLVGLVRRQFAVGQGNWGAVGFENTDPAAYRYTEVSSNKLVQDLAFEFIKFVDHHDPENLSYDQPKYLPCPIPIGLVGTEFIQGISFNTTKIPRYNLHDLIKRLIYLMQKQADPNIPDQLIYPQFPNCQIYEKTVGDFSNILTTGVGSIVVIPDYTVGAEEIRIHGRPALGFSALKKNADNPKKPDQRKFDNIDMTTKGVLDVWVQPQIGNVDQPFIDMIHGFLSNNVNFLCNVVYDDGIVRTTSIDDLLLTSYDRWTKAYHTKINSQKMAIIETLYELQVIAVVRSILQDNGSAITRTDDVVNIYNTATKYQDPKIGPDDIREIISKHKIKTLLEYSINTQTHKNKLVVLDNMLSNMNQTAYDKLMKTFS